MPEPAALDPHGSNPRTPAIARGTAAGPSPHPATCPPGPARAPTHSACVKALSPAGTAASPRPEQSTPRSPSQLHGAGQGGGDAPPLCPAQLPRPQATRPSRARHRIADPAGRAAPPARLGSACGSALAPSAYRAWPAAGKTYKNPPKTTTTKKKKIKIKGLLRPARFRGCLSGKSALRRPPAPCTARSAARHRSSQPRMQRSGEAGPVAVPVASQPRRLRAAAAPAPPGARSCVRGSSAPRAEVRMLMRRPHPLSHWSRAGGGKGICKTQPGRNQRAQGAGPARAAPPSRPGAAPSRRRDPRDPRARGNTRRGRAGLGTRAAPDPGTSGHHFQT